MNPKQLVQELEGSNPLQALELFVNEFESNNGSMEMLADLLIETPNFDRILNLLERENWTREELSVIFKTIGSFLMSLAADDKYENVGLHVTHFILQKYNKHLITLLITSNEDKCIVAGLKAITSMVVNSLPAATEVVRSLSFNKIEFTSFAEMEPEIRINFLYMILAFLSIEDDICVAQFVNCNSELITSVFEKLLYDPFEVVLKFLKLLRKIVLNYYVKKTNKTQLFNESTCMFLTKFYFHHLEEENKIPFTYEEKEKLKIEFHNFMIPLCSDLKHGIIYRVADYKMNSNIRNFHVFKILKTIFRPWELEEGRDLIIHILKACPDVIILFQKLTSGFTPQENYEFSSFMKLCVMYIEDKKPWEYVGKILEKDFQNKNIIFTPFFNLRHINSMIRSNSLILIHLGLLLLNSCIKKAKEIIDFMSSKPHLDENNKKSFQDTILKSVENLYFDSNMIFWLWYEVVKQEYEILPWFEEECPSKYILFVDMTEYMRHYVELFGYNTVRLKFNYIKMLQTKSNLIFPADDLNVTCKMVANLLKILIIAQKEHHFEAFGSSLSKIDDNDDIKINEDFFVCIVNFYTSSSNYNDTLGIEINELCFQLLKASIDNWGLSEYCQNFVEIWLNNINSKIQSDCSNFFAKVVSKTISNFFSYLDIMTNLSVESEETKSYSQINVLDYVNQIDPSIEIGDNEDITPRSIVIPFSCLILGAVDVLKEENNDHILSYFMNVVEEYIHRIDTPSVLSSYLLEKNILIGDTKKYLCYWINKQPVSIPLSSDKDLSFHLKFIFINGTSPQQLKSPLLENLESSIHDYTQIDSLCRQVYSYIQSEFKSFQSNNDKRKLKYFLKIFKKLIHITQKEPYKYLQLFEYLINHSFTIRNYVPFSSGLLYKDLESLVLQVVLEKYMELHRFIKPFMEKFISYVSTSVDDEKLSESLFMFFQNYSNICYIDIEKIILSLLKRDTDSFTEGFINIISEVFKILKHFSSLYCQPSSEVTVEVIKKMILLGRHWKSSEIYLRFFNLLSDYALAYFKPEIASNFAYNDLKHILKSRIANETFNKILQHSSHSDRNKLLKNVNNMKIHLSCQVPFVMSFYNENSECKSMVNSYLIRIKSHLIHCALNSDNSDYVNYQHATEYMLSKNMFELSDMVTVCRRYFEESDEPPYHILSLKPFFDYVMKKQAIFDNNDATEINLPSHSHIWLLSILMNVVAKFYGKVGDDNYFARIAETMLDIVQNISRTLVTENFYSNQLWLSFVKKVLKEDFIVSGTGSKLIDVLIHLVPIIYTKEKDAGVLPLRLFYQMLRSHSQFISLMIEENVNRYKLKEQIALLQLTIVQQNSNICEERHVPILLGAYGASRSLCDQYILKILYLYEKEGFMPTYDPTLWGQAAVAHFAVVQNREISSINIHYQSPSVKQVFSLIDYEKVIETALDFDMELGLEPVDIVEQSNITLYDQRFLLSLFFHFIQTDHELNIMQFVEKGFVALGIAALSSHRNEVWKAGAAVLEYIVEMFRKSNFKNFKNQWMWLVAVTGYGLEGKMNRIPSIITHFLIKASNILLFPQDVLYRPITGYLYKNSAFSLKKVPQLYRLLFSTDFQHKNDHRAFLFELLSSGIRDNSDIQLVISNSLPKLLLSSIISPCTDSHLRIKGMKVLMSIAKIPLGSSCLVKNGLLEHLPKSLTPCLKCHREKQWIWIDLAVDILTFVFHSIKRDIPTFTPDTLEPKIGSKRKHNVNIEKNVNDIKHIRKKRKLANGHLPENELWTNNKNMKFLKPKEDQIFHLITCLSFMYNTIICEGKIKSLIKTFNLMKEMLSFLKHLKYTNSSRKEKISFIKKQFKKWIENSSSEFQKRFQSHFQDDDAIYFGLKQISDWKFKPISSFTNSNKNNLGGLKDLISTLKDLSNIVDENNICN